MSSWSAAALGHAPDRAIRARLNALVLDGIIVAALSLVIVPQVAHSPAAGSFWLLAIELLYFFVLEAAFGRTIGKRWQRLRIAQLDGTKPTVRQYGIRNALRIFDALPLLYASGLISVIWTGPRRRQRIGDRVAGTTVILNSGGKPLRTPRWLLPAMTTSSVLASIAIYGVTYEHYRTRGQPPATGMFLARPQDAASGPVLQRWRIDKSCELAGCTYTITRDIPDFATLQGSLTAASDGWHVTFPPQAITGHCHDGRHVRGVQRSTLIIHFYAGGRTARAHESETTSSAACGPGASSINTGDWVIELASL